MSSIKFGILTVSDSCFRGEKIDRSGPELIRLINDKGTETGRILNGEVSCVDRVCDEEHLIMEMLTAWCDRVHVILTTGGTGFSERDVTPEATRKVIEKETYGITLGMLALSLKATPMAMLSRAISGIRKKTLIINLPGSVKAIRECLTAIAPVIPHAVHLILNDKTNIMETHRIVQTADIPCAPSCAMPSIRLRNLKNVAERNRESPYPMISVEAALDIISDNVETMQCENINLSEAHGRVLGIDVYSICDLPPFRASIKDGYAIIANDGQTKKIVLGSMKAGKISHFTLIPGTCVRVNTGAPVPNDATAVVQVEDTKLIEKSSDGMEEKVIEVLVEPKEGQDIRPIGSDLEKGSLILNAHAKLGAPELGLLAACGCNNITVFKSPIVGVVSTGDELQYCGEPLKPGCVYDSNKITLLSMLQENGFLSIDMGVIRDDETSMVKTIKQALKRVDVLVTSGSVSMGEKDMLKPVLQEYFQATMHFGRVNMKPGKPTTFATCVYENRKKYLLCLPGNPVSATVTAHLFVLPVLNKLHGDVSKPVIVKTKLTTSYNLDPRPEYARAILDWDDAEDLPKARSTGNQISSKLLSCKNANALLLLPGRTPDKQSLNEGEVVEAIVLGLRKSTV